jgi:hypothetical protein
MPLLFVREDDTVVCEDCRQDDPAILPAHLQIHSRIEHGACESCGHVVPWPGLPTPPKESSTP